MSDNVLGHNPHAVQAAERVYVNTPGPTHYRIAAAISAYQFTLDGAIRTGDGTTHYPIPEDVDAYLAFLRADTAQNDEDTAQ